MGGFRENTFEMPTPVPVGLRSMFEGFGRAVTKKTKHTMSCEAWSLGSRRARSSDGPQRRRQEHPVETGLVAPVRGKIETPGGIALLTQNYLRQGAGWRRATG